MNLRKILHPYVASDYPILYLVTFDEETADSAIRELADNRNVDDRKVRISEWNMAHGFVHFDTKLPVDTKLPEQSHDECKYQDLYDALDIWLADDLRNDFLIVRDAHLALRDNPNALARLKALTHKIIRKDRSGYATIFLVSSQLCVPSELEPYITVIEPPPTEHNKISMIVHQFAEDYSLSVDDEKISKLTKAFRGLSEYQIMLLLKRGYLQTLEDGHIDIGDIKLMRDEKEQIVKKSGLLEMVQVNEQIDIGGLKQPRHWLENMAKIMYDLPRANNFGVDSPKGAMIVGKPGCGKSLLAKIAAVQFDLPLLRLDIGSLMGSYIGDSEGNMRRALSLAETVSPCVLWVDELEKAFAGIDSRSTGGGTDITRRLFGNFLTWMQENTKPVFVLATTNDVSAIPPELLRKGRFDEIFKIELPNCTERAEILKVHLKKRRKDTCKIKMVDLAHKTEGFSGADLEGVVKDAIELAFLQDEACLNTDHMLESIDKNKRRIKLITELKANSDEVAKNVCYEG